MNRPALDAWAKVAIEHRGTLGVYQEKGLPEQVNVRSHLEVGCVRLINRSYSRFPGAHSVMLTDLSTQGLTFGLRDITRAPNAVHPQDWPASTIEAVSKKRSQS